MITLIIYQYPLDFPQPRLASLIGSFVPDDGFNVEEFKRNNHTLSILTLEVLKTSVTIYGT